MHECMRNTSLQDKQTTMRVLISLALLGAVMAVPKHIERIVGGQPTTIEKYPFMANMQFGWLGSLFRQSCGGTLITIHSVVSAAHCFGDDPPSWWRVLLGTSNRHTGGSEHLVQSIILHEQFQVPTQLNNDVAIIRLVTPAALSDTVAVARVAGPNYNLADNTRVTAIGWGALSSGGSSPNQLQEVDIYTINQELCVSRYAYLKTLEGFRNFPDVTDQMLCAGILDVGGKDACQGDSGGPLVHDRDVLVGIVSWGFGCADSEYPGVNARVSALVAWIITNGS